MEENGIDARTCRKILLSDLYHFTKARLKRSYKQHMEVSSNLDIQRIVRELKKVGTWFLVKRVGGEISPADTKALLTHCLRRIETIIPMVSRITCLLVADSPDGLRGNLKSAIMAAPVLLGA